MRRVRLDLLDGIPGMLQAKRCPSQLNRVSEHLVAQLGAERGIGDTMDAAARQILQSLLDGDEVEAGIERDQQVEIASGMCRAACRRAEAVSGCRAGLWCCRR